MSAIQLIDEKMDFKIRFKAMVLFVFFAAFGPKLKSS
jgi:hypothetical protein